MGDTTDAMVEIENEDRSTNAQYSKTKQAVFQVDSGFCLIPTATSTGLKMSKQDKK